MPGSAGSKYGIKNDGLPVTAKGKVMSKLEPFDQVELAKAFLFMEDTGVYVIKAMGESGYPIWVLNWDYAKADISKVLESPNYGMCGSGSNEKKNRFATALEAIQAAMKLLNWGE